MSEPIVEEPKVEEPKTEHPGLDHLSQDDQDKIITLRRENADRRTKANELEKEINKLNLEKKEREDAKLKEDGKLQELLDAKEAELLDLPPLKEKVENYENYFKEQLEAQLEKLTDTQRELINESDMEISKKLKWAIKLQDDGVNKKLAPDGARPGGKAPSEEINIADYSGPDGRKKLVELSRTNRPLYDAIVKEKNNI